MNRTPLDILVIAPNAGSSFVEKDVEGLGRHFVVDRIAYRDYPGKLAFLRDVGRRLRSQRPALVLLWFLTPAYSLETMALARLFGSRVAVVVGGLEVDYVPELGLGGLRWPHNRVRQRIGIRSADLVVAHSRFLAERIERVATPRRLEILALGVDTDRFSPDGAKERLAMTTCFEVTQETAPLKGLPAFVGAAGLIPDTQFVLVGQARDDALDRLAEQAPPNVRFAGRVSDDELLDLFRRAKVYVQVSAHESFGVAVVESMSCGCVPVLAEQAALPEVAGDAALYVPFGDTERTAAAIRTALELPDAAGRRGRERALERYSIEQRFDRLAGLLRPFVLDRK
jgi:glycosyltransferase involved in cell wall biosynthesis